MKIRFTTRDLLWLTVVLALLASRVEMQVAVSKAVLENNLRWHDLARGAGVFRQIDRETWRRNLE